jgi:uncharacterized protein (DUF427 family)
MTNPRTRLEPGPDHPIAIDPKPGHVTVRRGSAVIAESDRALELREANYPPVLYIPLPDVDQHRLGPNDDHTYCPYKGEASYYDILPGDGDTLPGAVWYYPDPYSAVDAIRGHVAFYADHVTITSES